MDIKTCSSCGGSVEFSPKDKLLKCVKCGNLYNVEYTNYQFKHPIDWVPDDDVVDKWISSNRAYKCDTCGAIVTYNRYDIASKCQYCNATSLVDLNELPGLRPEKIIPFKIDKTDAKQQFKNNVLKRKFLPNQFKKDLPNVDISSTYLSAFSFDCMVNATYSGRQSYTKTVRDKDGRSHSVTEYRNFSGKIDKQFIDLVVESSDKINQAEIRGILPYDFSECYDYEDDFIKGYNVGYYNQDVKDAEYVAKEEMVKMLEREIRNRYSSVDYVNIKPTYSNMIYNYTLLPAYFVNYNYKNKPYINMMNGQTGKLTGKVPRSNAKITLFVLMILLIIGIPIIAILLLT
ncbi:MAG: hypothetical protein ACLRFE_00050 [Clostridia bacterium]